MTACKRLFSLGCVLTPMALCCSHLDFTPDGRFLYVTNELDNSLSSFTHDGETGLLTPLQTLSSLPEGWAEAHLMDVRTAALPPQPTSHHSPPTAVAAASS